MIRLPGSMPVSWWHVVTALEKHGYTHSAVGAAIGSRRSTVENWKNRGASPPHDFGESLIELWQAVTGKSREDLPRQQGVISAAKVSQPSVRSAGVRPVSARLLAD